MKIRTQKQTAIPDTNSGPKKNTLNLSELSPHEKNKYLEFLLSKNISFQEDKDGNMVVAKIRVKGPQVNQSMSIANKENTLPIVRESTRQPKQKPQMPYVGKRSKTPTSAYDQSSFTGGVGPFVDAYAEQKTTNARSARYHSRRHSHEDVQEIKQKQTRKKSMNCTSENFSKEDPKGPKSAKVKRKLPQNDDKLILLSECFNEYRGFFEEAGIEQPTSLPKRFSRSLFSRIIEEIYTLKFAQDIEELRLALKDKQAGNRDSNQQLSSQTFTQFCKDYFKLKFQTEPYIYNTSLSFVYSLYYYRKKLNQATLFSKFLSEKYNKEDLSFFLFLRSLTEKELNILFIKTREDFPIGDHYNITIRACQAISEKAFGKNEKKLIASVMRKTRDFIHEHEIKDSRLNLYDFLIICAKDYHKNRLNGTFKDTQTHSHNSHSQKESDVTIREIPNQVDTHSAKSGYFSFRGNDEYSPTNEQDLEYESKQRIEEESESIEDEQENFIVNNQPIKQPHHTGVLKASNVININFSNPFPLSEKSGFNQKIAPQKPSYRLPEPNLIRSDSSNGSERSLLQERCESLMAKKLNDFLDVSLFDGDNFGDTHLLSVKESIFKTAYLKIMGLVTALFTHNKVAWLNALSIENPTGEQLDYIESLQRELRRLQKESSTGKILNEDLEKFVLKIFRNPELTAEIGRLIFQTNYNSDSFSEEMDDYSM